MFKHALTAVLFAVPLCAAAYDYDALPKQAASKETPITHEEAFPDLTGKSYTEIEDIDTKVARLAKQAKYKQQQAEKAKAEAEAAQKEAPAAAPARYIEVEDIDVKLEKAQQRRKAGKPQPVREIWHADPATGTHDWTAVPADEFPQDEFPQDADSGEFPQETPADEFPQDASSEEFPQDEFPQK